MSHEHKSLMKKHLTEEVKKKLKGVKTPHGFTVEDAIRSGVANEDSSVGVYAGDEESYTLLAPLFDPIIFEYHGHGVNDMHRADLDAAKLEADSLDPDGTYVVSTRIRVGRNLRGYGFAPAITREHRREVERRVVESLREFDGDLAGTYYPLEGMDEATRMKLVADHFLFKKGDRFLEAGGANRDWPEGRGIFHSADKRFLVWVNEEDELRIISMQEGANVREVFSRLSRAIDMLQRQLQFAYSDHLGYLSSCPTNLGTAMRASVHVKLPKLGKDEARLKRIAKELKLSVRGVDGEHSESKGGVYDISNKQRLGISEAEAVNLLIRGVGTLIMLEKCEA